MVPFYQRTYVWSQQDQWEPLWDDIRDKANARVAGDEPAPHFLGAVVLDRQTRKGIIGVETLHIIDGQQRLTTLQFVLKSALLTFGSYATTEAMKRVSSAIVSAVENQNLDMMHDREREVFKVYPTFFDVENHKKAFGAKNINELKDQFPDSFTQLGKLKKQRSAGTSFPPPHPKPLEAILFFANEFSQWVEDGGENEVDMRCESLAQAILQDFKVITITLDEYDDAQVIFETLNGRGAELHATDLIRNFIFMRADSEGFNSENLYNELWKGFEDSYWKEEQRRGRATKPVLEWFFHVYLQSITCREVDLGRLYFEYRQDIDRCGKKAEEQLTSLVKYAAVYRKLANPVGDDPISTFGRKIAPYDITTLHSLALFIDVSDVDNDEKAKMFDYLLSYVVRRAICGLTQKNYNNVFIRVLSKLSEAGPTAVNLRNILMAQKGEATRWPRDEEFANVCKSSALYPGTLDAPKMRAVLEELENHLRRTAQGEDASPVNLQDVPDIDHILPRSWFSHWPLLSGESASKDEAPAIEAKQLAGLELNEREQSIANRQSIVPTLGNLTLLNLKVNREAQNKNFATKQKLLIKNTNLRLNIDLLGHDAKSWDEESIKERSEKLANAALCVWPGE